MTAPGGSTGNRTHRLVALLLLIYVLYAAGLIWRNSFEVGTERHFVLLDDAMVSMQYARNLAAGHGLVWNARGPAVEGITNPAWTLLMAAVHLLPVAASRTGLWVQILGALFLTANLWVTGRIASLLSGSDRLAVIGTVAMTGLYYPLNRWSVVGGLETGPLALLVSLSVLCFLRCRERGGFSATPYLLLALCLLIRPDMTVISVAGLGMMAWLDGKNRRAHLMKGGAILLCAVLFQTVFRYVYYGDVLPNTYYLKMTGFPVLARMGRGLAVTLESFVPAVWLILALPVWHVFRRRDGRYLLPLGVIAAQILYSIYAGGDAWEYYGGTNRFLAIVLPLTFAVFCCAAASEAGRLFRESRSGLRRVGIGVLIVCMSAGANLGGSMPRQALLISPAPFTPVNARNVRWAESVAAMTTDSARVAVYSAGVIPYFSGRNCIDMLGKNDSRIAHQPMHIIPGSTGFGFYTGYFLPGHLKWDYAYSIGELKPDVIVGNIENQEAEPYLAGVYRKIESETFTGYIREGSGNLKPIPRQNP